MDTLTLGNMDRRIYEHTTHEYTDIQTLQIHLHENNLSFKDSLVSHIHELHKIPVLSLYYTVFSLTVG